MTGLAGDVATVGLPGEAFQNAFLIGSGQALSAGQVQGGQQFAAQLGQNEQQFAADLALRWSGQRLQDRIQTTQLSLQEIGLSLDADRLALAAKEAQSGGSIAPLQLIEQMTTTKGMLSDSRIPKSEAQKQWLVNLLNSLTQQAAAMGIVQGQTVRDPQTGEMITLPPPPMRVEDIAPTSFMDWLNR